MKKYNWFTTNAIQGILVAATILLMQGCGFIKSKTKGGKGVMSV